MTRLKWKVAVELALSNSIGCHAAVMAEEQVKTIAIGPDWASRRWASWGLTP
ncbi:hypothetical protein [Ensifer adhaerens]|uniref:hypothetical protein n=1 Tax=Ensifer adhaerens TaxID=106592 RepID=UPI0015EC961F|nr:hypothetical protein [Ensifer adhaerens]